MSTSPPESDTSLEGVRPHGPHSATNAPLTLGFQSRYDGAERMVTDTSRADGPLSRLATLGYLEGMAMCASLVTDEPYAGQWRKRSDRWNQQAQALRSKLISDVTALVAGGSS